MAQLLQPKQQLAGYELGELVGKGGMGEVYRARQISMDRVVALKILAPRLAKQDPIFAKRFVDEARAAGRLNHSNIVAVHDVGKAPMPGAEPGTPELDYFSMEFVDGESVKEVIERQGILPLSLTGQVMQGMSEALVYAEAQGIVHRDIKPDNIMITSSGIVKLADLGLALQLGGEDGLAEKDEQGRGKVMGTPLYMSPEQARALPVDSHSDQYSLGATLFHMLTGKPPFKGDSAKAIMKSHVFDPVPDPRAINPEVPEVWRQLCMKMMAKNPEERFANCVLMRTAVQATISGQGGPGVSKRVRTNGWAMTKDRANVMPGWARMLVYGFAFAVVAMVAFFAIPWGGGGHASVEPVKPPVLAQPVIDQQALAAKQMDRVRQALQALPFEPDKALPMLDALAGDKTITLPAARELIAQETAKRKIQLDERLRKQREAEQEKLRLAKAAEVQKAMVAGNLAQVKECLAVIEPEFDKLPKTQQDRVAVVRQQYQLALIDLQKKFTDRIVQSQKAPELATVLGEIKASPLGEDALRSLDELATRRGSELGKSTSPAVEDQVLWQALSDQLEPLRGSLSYGEIKRIAEAESAKFGTAQGRELAQSLVQLGALSIPAEGSLRNFINTTNPIVEIQVGTEMRKVKLRRIDAKEVEFLPLDIKGDSPLKQDRKTVSLPLRELVEQALTGDGIQGVQRWRMMACILWVWRAPEAAEIFAKFADEPLAKAVVLVEARARVLDLRARVTKAGKQIVVTYDTTGKNPWFAEDFISEDPPTVVERGISWSSVRKSIPGTLENQVPTLRWKASLLPPLNLSYQFYLRPNTQLIALGVLGGERRVRAGFNNLLATSHRIFPLLTKDDGSTYEYQAAWVKNGFFKSTETIRVDIAVNADFKVTLKFNEILLKEGLQLPVGQPITPIVQSVQFKDGQTAIDLSMMSISGVLPEDGAGK